jgi:hypothetical protein
VTSAVYRSGVYASHELAMLADGPPSGYTATLTIGVSA